MSTKVTNLNSNIEHADTPSVCYVCEREREREREKEREKVFEPMEKGIKVNAFPPAARCGNRLLYPPAWIINVRTSRVSHTKDSQCYEERETHTHTQREREKREEKEKEKEKEINKERRDTYKWNTCLYTTLRECP